MKTKVTKVETYRVDRVCESCEVGLLGYTGELREWGWPYTLEHRCPACGHVEYLSDVSPRYDHVPSGSALPTMEPDPRPDSLLLEEYVTSS